MKNYTITVNGNVYNVTVEEGTTAGVVQAPLQQHRRQLLQHRRQQLRLALRVL